MDIQQKIEEIRQKPESERWKYVWGCVAFSMVLVLMLWVLSLQTASNRIQDKSLDRVLQNTPLVETPSQVPEKSVENAPSLDEWLKKGKSGGLEATQDNK